MAKTALEERLEAITREFVQQIVATIRSASFADVAGYGSNAAPPERASAYAAAPAKKTRVVATPKRGAGERQTADRRAELAERILESLRKANEPLGVRQLASLLAVPVDLLQTPLLELRAAGRVAKHGEKRATTYSLT